MNDGVDLVVFESDGWDAIYIDGALVYAGSEHLIRQILDFIRGKTIVTARCQYAEPRANKMGDYLEEYGNYPSTLAEVEEMGEVFE